ncbi:MAG: HEAT repeat domain-containing protein [Planctomycetota bacterium]
MWRILPLLLLPATLATADDMKGWQKAQREIGRDEKKYWDEFKGRFTQALQDFREPVSRVRNNLSQDKEAVYDYRGIDALYEEARALGTRRGEVDARLELDDPKAFALLLKSMLDDCKLADRIEADLAEGKPDFGRYTFNQESGCRLELIAARQAKRIPALGAAPIELLTRDGWKKCVRGDGRKSVRRRVALLDAVAARGDKEAIDFLKEPLSDKRAAIRIAALEAMIRCGGPVRPILEDESGAVRRALLLAAPADPAWFGAVLAHASKAGGFERDLCIRLLARISNQKFGYDLTAWQAWFEDYEAELEGGKFDVKTVEVADAEPKANADAISFYGLDIASNGAFFAIDASQHIAMPADVDVQRTQWRDKWRGTRRSWEKEHEAHKTAVTREFSTTFETFPEDFRWGLLTMFGRFSTKAAGEKKLLGTKSKDLKLALKLIDQAPEKGWCSPLGGLLAAAEYGGDGIDTIVLWHHGDPSGGRFMSAKPSVAAWRRFNRFHRLQVIAVRISNRKEPAETFMRGVAEESGGRYHWAKKPPASGG